LRVAHEAIYELTKEGQQVYNIENTISEHSMLPASMKPHIIAVREEFTDWAFFYFEPRERMRQTHPAREVRQLGLMGEDLASFLNTLKATNERQFHSVEKAIQMLIPSITGIEVGVNDSGEIDLKLQEGDIPIPARLVSEGTLRILGLLTLTSMQPPPSLIGFEEPENGIHPTLSRYVAEFFNTQRLLGKTQFILTTHSAVLLDLLPKDSLFVSRKKGVQTLIQPISEVIPMDFDASYDSKWEMLDDEALPELSLSERVLRGDLNA
jgi:predicted ATPase